MSMQGRFSISETHGPKQYNVETKTESSAMQELSDDKNTGFNPNSKYDPAREIANKIRVDGDDDQEFCTGNDRFIRHERENNRL